VAAAATLKSENGVVTYRAKRGERNAPYFIEEPTQASQLIPELISDIAPLTLGPGCTTGARTLCSPASAPIDIGLGDRDDSARVSTTGSTTIDGGDGDDTVRVSSGTHTVYGRDGDDTIYANSDFGGQEFGGSGDDGIVTLGIDVASGEGGDDLVVTAFATIPRKSSGGTGSDRLVAFGSQHGAVFAGDSGDDVIATTPGTPFASLEGGSGADTIDGGYGSSTVDGGTGRDAINVIDRTTDDGSTPDTVTCGSGYDVVWADADDDVAADCETRLDGAAPDLPGVSDAIAAAADLLDAR